MALPIARVVPLFMLVMTALTPALSLSTRHRDEASDRTGTRIDSRQSDRARRSSFRDFLGKRPRHADGPISRPGLWQVRPALPAPRMEMEAQPPVVDVVSAAALTPFDAGELDPTIDVQITQEIVDKAVELGTAQAMYEFVRDRCRFQTYHGSRKGSVETLRQRAGNDYDQASLLIALLRASGIPARYAEGTVEMPLDRVNGWLAVDADDVAGSILYTNGMEGTSMLEPPSDCCVDHGTPGCEDPDIEACVCAVDPSCCDTAWDQQCADDVISFGCDTCDPVVVAIRARRVWVEAFVPRGFGAPTWVPLDPAFAQTDIHAGLDVIAEMGLDMQAFVDEYWGPEDPGVPLPRPEPPLELLEVSISDYLDTHHPGMTLADVRRTHEIVAENLGAFPASLPYTVRSRDAAFTEIPPDRRYRIRFQLHDGGTNLVDHTFDLPAIASKRVTIDYVGATPADEAIIDANGGIYQTPPWEVELKPVLRLDGVDVAVGTSGVGMGLTHESDIHFLAPTNGSGLPQNVVPSIFNVITTGASQAIGFSIEGISERLLITPPDDDVEGLAVLRHDTVMDYLSSVHEGASRLGRLMHAHVTTDVANAIVENVVNVELDALGDPLTFEWKGLRVDADRSVLGVWPPDHFPPGEDPREFAILAGAEASILGSRVYEFNYGQDSVSTIKILELAHDAEITIYKRWDSLPLPPNSHSSSDRQAIENAILGGLVVTFPADPMTLGEPDTGQWTGTGWIAMNPATGAAGHVVSDHYNGGATYEAWPPGFIDLSEEDRSIRDVAIEITKPLEDSPHDEAIFTRDSEEHLLFEYKVHVTYDDETTRTVPGPGETYKRKTRNTTMTLGPGNYTFRVWIGRSVHWPLLATIAGGERDVSIVGVWIREEDGSVAGLTPPGFIPVKPPQPEATPFVDLKARVIPEKAPDGTDLATAYAWSGGSKLSFTPTDQVSTRLEPAGSSPSAAVDDQQVDVAVNLVGGRTATGCARFNLTAGSFDEPHEMTVFRARAKELSFSGSGYHVVREDDGSAGYDPPHWQDNNDDGDAKDPGDRRFPVSFPRGSRPEVTARIVFEPGAALSGTPRLRADGPGSLDLAETGASIGDNQLTITDKRAKSDLPGLVRFYDPFELRFELKLDGERHWWKAGTTDNRVYVTLRDPVANTLFETLLDIGCRNADGNSADGGAVAAVWSDFADPIPGVRRKKMDGHNNSDDVTMRYWNPVSGTSGTLEGLLAHESGNGTCGAWSLLLHETLNALGIGGSEIWEVRADTTVHPDAEGFLVKNWNFGLHVRSGPDGVNDTVVAGDDFALCATGQGFPEETCVSEGSNGALETRPSGDDAVEGVTVHTGANGICETTAAGDDEQELPVGQGRPDMACITPGADGTLNSVAAADDTTQDGLFAGTDYPYALFENRIGNTGPLYGVDYGDAADQDGIPGQGNGDPPELFYNHFVVKFGGNFYDPSYGAGPFASELAHEDAAIDGLFRTLGDIYVATKDGPEQELVYSQILATDLPAASRSTGGESPSTGETEPVTGESEILAALAYPAREPDRRLSVVKTPLPMPDPMEYLRSPETLQYPGNFVFVVVDSGLRNVEGGQVVGLVYATENRSMVPRQYWGAGLVWIEERQAPYLVVVKAVSRHVTMSVYEVDSGRRIGDHPLVLDPSRFEAWPEADEPVAVAEKTLAGKGPCGVSSIDVYAEDGQIRIGVSRTRTGCPASTIGFDIEKGEWTEVD